MNGAAVGGGGLCYNQTGGRTTNGTSTVSSGSQTSAGSNASASQTWTGAPFPTTVTVTDVNGNLVQVPGTALAQASTGSSSAASVSNAIQDIASTAFRTMTGTNATGCLEAFERVGLARTLAEPNLTSVNGESANFLAGGEFPLPTGRDRDGNITVTYKPYGVGLAFRPIVLSAAASRFRSRSRCPN